MRRTLMIILWLLIATPVAAGEQQILIGVLAKRGEAQTLTRWGPTADYLSDQIPGYRFTVVPLGFAEIEEAVADGTIDFVLTNSAIYVELEMRYGAGRIVTLRNRHGEHGYTRFGGVIFTRADRNDIDSLEALRGARFAAVDGDSLGGYLTARRELYALGIIPEQHTVLSFTGTHDAVVQAVLTGEVDAGTVRTDTLERMAAEGALSLEQVKVLNPQRHDDFDFLCSTRLYPEWPLARLAHTPERLSHAVASALLRMPSQSAAAISGEVSGWTVPRNYQPVHELMREMRIGPYEYLGRITLQDLLRNYWQWLLLTLLALLLLTAATLYFRQLNRRLRMTEAELIDARDNLADKVRERTAELEQSRARLERISRDWNDAFDAISDPIFIHDENMHIVQANPAYCQRAGHGLSEMVGKPYYHFFPPMQGPLPACSTFPERLHARGDELTLDSGEVFISRSFGIQRADNSVVHALHILEDVTEVRQAEVRRRLLSRALEQAGEGIIILDRQRRLSYCNPALRNLRTGDKELESIEQLVTGQFAPALQGLFEEASQGGDTASGEMELRGGGQLPVFITVGLIRDEKGAADGYVLTLLDLSEVKQAEQALTYRLGFESVIARMAAGLVNVATDNLSAEVMKALGQVGEFAAVDRAYLFELDDGTMSVTYEWCADGIQPQARRLQQVPFDSLPWLRERIMTDGLVVVPDAGRLPEEAEAERQEFEVESIRSLLLVALGGEERPSGLIGFDNVRQLRDWAKEDVGLLRAAGDILINAITRVRTLRNLERSEASLAAAQAIAHLGSWEWDIVSGGLAWSDEVFRIFGLQPQEVDVTYEAFLNTIHPDDREAVSAAVNRAVAGEEGYAVDHRIVRPDGSERIVHEIGDVTFDEQNKPRRMIGTVQDVTSLRRAEREAHSLNRALRTLSLCNTTLVHATDEQALLERICHILIDNGGYRFAWVGYKLPENEVLQVAAYADHGKNLVDSLEVHCGEDAPHPAGQAADLREAVIVRDIATAGGVDEMWRDRALALGYGSVIALPLISDDELFGTITIDADTSDAFDEQEVRLLREMAGDLAFGIRILRSRKQRERAEQALKQTEERYEELYENAPNGYLSAAAEDGRLLQCNQALLNLLGYSRQELEQMHLLQLYADTADGREKVERIMQQLHQGEGARDVELQMLHRKGHIVWVSVSIDQVFDKQGELCEIRTMVIDITARKQAEDERRQFAERLQRSLFQTIRAIAITIEKRDPYTAGHQERVAELAVKLGKRMGLDEQALEGVRLGALIHDIGKISVPAEILNRPGHLEPEMFAIIRTHPRSGYEIISGIDFPWPLAEMVLQHHERLDGSGYPRGLKGDEILLEARILAVADVVEAMASHRPYRASLGSSAALDEIEQGKGTIYDPEVVEQCQAIFEEEGSPWPEPER